MQYQSPMEEKQRGSKVLHVLEASSDGLEFLNVSIESFSSSVVSSQCHCIDHSVYVSIEHISDFGNLRNASLHRLIAPHDEQGGSCRPATVTSGFTYSSSTWMLSSISSVEMRDIRQSLPCGRSREASISSVLFVMAQRYKLNGIYKRNKHVNLY